MIIIILTASTATEKKWRHVRGSRDKAVKTVYLCGAEMVRKGGVLKVLFVAQQKAAAEKLEVLATSVTHCC